MRNKSIILTKIAVLVVGIFLMGRIFLPLIEMEFNENSKGLFLQVLGKSTGVLENHVNKTMTEDESTRDLSSYIVENLTGMDLSSPTSFLTSQIPILGVIDMDKISSTEEKEPIIVSQADEAKKNEKPVEENTPPKNVDQSKPEILIYHTHTTEGYNPSQEAGANFTSDITKTVAKVGDELEKELEAKYGISTIHDKTIHDLPKRDGAYSKSRPTIEKYLKEYPSIKIVIDLHRDGGVAAEKVTATVDGKKYARPMFVVGSKNKNYSKNEESARAIHNEIEKLYPKFSRGLMFKSHGIYNQDLSASMVLIEIGSEMNSLDEAIETMKLLSKALSNRIAQMK